MKNLYSELLDEIADKARLVAVSKTKPNEAIMHLYDQGQRAFGENRVPELVQKFHDLPNDIEWHMIGHLQTNKVKNIISFVHLVHSGDRISILNELNKQAAKKDRKIEVLLQMKIAQENSKYGWSIEDLRMHKNELLAYENLIFRGVMGMATFSQDTDLIRSEFKQLKLHFDELKNSFFTEQTQFDTISMGMSGDYQIAIEEGSTMIRVGSLLFGSRN